MTLRIQAGAFLVAACLSVVAAADDAPQAKTAPAVGKSAVPELPSFTSEREAAALEFVREHHAELGMLLARLRELKRDEYERAIRELFQTRTRLAAVRAGDERQYALALELWQVESQVKVLAARHAVEMKKDLAFEQELKELLYKQVDLQRRLIEYNRDRVLESLETMNANVKLLRDKREEFVQRRLKNLIHTPANAATRPPQAAPQ